MIARERQLYRYLWIFAIVLCTMLSISGFFGRATFAFAEEEQNKIIKVGQFSDEGQIKVDQEGNYSGYEFDYLQEIAKYTGWQYDFVVVPSREKAVDMLRQGEIDLIGKATKSSATARELNFSKWPMISEYGVLGTTLANEALPYDGFAHFGKMRIGAVADSQMIDSFRSYGEAHNMEYDLFYYNTQDELHRAVKTKKVDAVILTSAAELRGLRIVGKFGGKDSYFAVAEKNKDVLSQLDYAMQQIRFNNPYFNDQLSRKYANLQVSTPVSFTKAELEYIKNSKPIKCTYDPAVRPISYYDEKDGEAKGIAIDIANLIHQKTGLDFQLVHAEKSKEAMALFANKEVPLYLTKTEEFSWAQKYDAILTTPYLEGYTVKVTNREAENKEIVAVYDRIFQNELTQKIIADASEIKTYSTVVQCLDAVRNGTAGTTFVNSTVMSYELENPKFSNLKTVALYGYGADTCMAVSDSSEPELVSILNKVLGSISTTQINQIVANNMKTDHHDTLANILYAHPLESILVVVGFLLLLMLIFITNFRMRIKNAKIMERTLYTDDLTGYPNYECLSKEVPKIVGQKHQKYVVVYMDIHQFKTINDTFGYDAGDRALKNLSDILNEFIKEDERFARVYADKFVLLLKDGPPGQFNQRMENLSGQLKKLSSGEFEMVNFLFSGGIYRFKDDEFDLDMAFDRANYAKDTIHDHFSNSFVFYDDIMRNQVLEEKYLESSMVPALENGEFQPFYQPKVNTITGELVGAEALVRWMHPEKGCISPGVFLPFYEKNGFIVRIDFAIFEAVCQHIKEWISTGQEMVPVSVNFSRRHMQNKLFAERLKAIIDRHQVPARLLEIEITETIALDNVDTAVAFAESLKKYGFSISIDDYGTGYSSISFLQELPLDVLKLDKEFIHSAMRSRKARDIMSHLVTAMKKNEIFVLCEGIETQEQRDFIVSLNCRFVQGYYYSQPMAWEEFKNYMKTSQIAGNDYLDFAPIGNIAETVGFNAAGFLEDVMPGWIMGLYVEENYPIFYISPKMIDSLGYSEPEFFHVTNNNFTENVHPDDVDQVLEQLAVERLDEYRLQYRFRKRDGTYLWIRNIGRKVITEEGKETFVGVCTDITDVLTLQQEREALLETIPGGVCQITFTEDGPIIQSATEAFYEIIGHTPKQMEQLGYNMFSIVHPQDMDVAADAMRKMRDEGHLNCECIFRVEHEDKTLHWLSVRGTLRDRGEGKSVTAIIYNIDAEIHEKQESQIAGTKLNMALTMTDDAIYEYDIATKCIYEQSGIYTYLPEGLSLDNIPESMIEKGVVHPEDEEALREMYSKVSEGVAHAFCEVRVYRENSSEKMSYMWIRLILSVIYDEDGNPDKAVGIIENIDRQKQIENAFAKEEQYRRAMAASTILSYDVNLTKDTFDRIVGNTKERLLGVRETLKNPNCYTELISTAVSSMIVEKDRERLLHELGRENLLQLYHQGVIEKEFEYRRLMPDNTELWVAAAVHLIPEEATGDVLCFASYHDIHTKKVEEESLKEQAARDPLTGVFNRASGEELIEQALKMNSGGSLLHGFMMIDANRFKVVNDSYGHRCGDEVLVGISSAIMENLRESDIVTRIGGDEFVVLVKNLRAKEVAVVIAQKICDRISQVRCSADSGYEASVSIGIAVAPEHGTDFTTLYHKADKAMYQAKKTEGDHIVVYDEEK